MREKTLRYPGHAEKACMLRELGFFSNEPVLIHGQEVRPLDVTSHLLLKGWRLESGMDELTVMRVDVWGRHGDTSKRLRCHLSDRTDPQTGEFSMARTTGYPAVLTARLVAQGRLAGFGPGIVPAERLAEDDSAFAFVMDGLQKAGISLEFSDV
jgi:saccharopine dehydrogenase-like NADP-dependent oxidoreductase